jgi:predicted nucleotidyltransferase
VKLKIVRPEDLIGLKVLAYSNDPSREERDKSDILLLNEAHRNAKIKLDLEKIKSYYEMFDKLDDYSKVWSKK